MMFHFWVWMFVKRYYYFLCAAQVRLQLQEKLDVDLTERKKEVDQLVMEVIDEQTQDDGEEEEEEDEEEEEEDEAPPPKKKPAPKPKKRAASESGSDAEGVSEEEVPSDGGGSDYEPDEPVKISKGRKSAVTVKKGKFGSDDDGSSGEEWGGAKKGGSKKGRKKKSQDSDDSDYEKPKKKRKSTPGLQITSHYSQKYSLLFQELKMVTQPQSNSQQNLLTL